MRPTFIRDQPLVTHAKFAAVPSRCWVFLLLTVQSLKATSLHFHLDKMETGAARRPGFELNFVVVARICG